MTCDFFSFTTMRTLSLQKLLTRVKGIRLSHRTSRYNDNSNKRTSVRSYPPINNWVDMRIKSSNQIPKPQITREGVDNSDTPFVPSLREGVKPNAIARPDANHHTSLDDTTLHPYYEELQTIEYAETVFMYR